MIVYHQNSLQSDSIKHRLQRKLKDYQDERKRSLIKARNTKSKSDIRRYQRHDN